MSRRIGQVIAPLLVIRRVANKSALTSNTTVTGHVGSFHVGSRWSSTVSSVPPGGHSFGSAGTYRKDTGEFVVGDESTIDIRRGGEV